MNWKDAKVSQDSDIELTVINNNMNKFKQGVRVMISNIIWYHRLLKWTQGRC
jgi:hypothetical protein